MYRGRGRRGRGGYRYGGRAYFIPENKPKTKVAQHVLDNNNIRQIDAIYYSAVPIRDDRIPQALLSWNLKDTLLDLQVIKSSKGKTAIPVDRRKHKAIVLVGDTNGHVGIGIVVGNDVAHAIRKALSEAMRNIFPVQRGYFSSKLGQPHTVPFKVTGSCGGVKVSLRPAVRGTGLSGGKALKKIFSYAGLQDVLVKVHAPHGSTNSTQNLVKATMDALAQTSATVTFVRPELWARDGEKRLYNDLFNPVAPGCTQDSFSSYWKPEEEEKEKEKESEEGEKEMDEVRVKKQHTTESEWEVVGEKKKKRREQRRREKESQKEKEGSVEEGKEELKQKEEPSTTASESKGM